MITYKLESVEQELTALSAMKAHHKSINDHNAKVLHAISDMVVRLELDSYGEVIADDTQITVRFDDKYFNFSTHNANGVLIFLDNTITKEKNPNIKGNGVPVSFHDWLGDTVDCNDDVIAVHTANKFRKFMMSNF